MYDIQVFEGMKAYRCDDGSIQMFRPEENMKRLSKSAERLSLPVNLFLFLHFCFVLTLYTLLNNTKFKLNCFMLSF